MGELPKSDLICLVIQKVMTNITIAFRVNRAYNVTMNIKLSSHAEQRVNSRLSKVVSQAEVLSKIDKVSARLTDHRNFVLIKKMPYTEIKDEDVRPDGIARGDMVIALVEEGVIESVMLRKSWSLSPEYKKIIH